MMISKLPAHSLLFSHWGEIQASAIFHVSFWSFIIQRPAARRWLVVVMSDLIYSKDIRELLADRCVRHNVSFIGPQHEAAAMAKDV